MAAGYANDNTSGTISGNKVDFQAGSVVHTVAGGYARGNSSDVLNNNVTISGGTIGKANGPGRVAGGYIYGRSDPSSGDLRDNRVDFSGGQAYSVYGGYIDSKGTGNVSGNKVFVSGGQIGGASANPGDVGTVAGASVGANSLGNLTNNTVNFTDGEAKLVIGAVAGFKAANNLSSNRVDILGGNASNVIGGSTGENFSGNVTYNIVNISGANVSGNITGGFVGANSTGSFVSNNTVYFSSPYNATKIVGGFVGNNSDEIISYNQVIIVDGNVTEGVVGGFASKGVADNNTLDITNSHFGSAYGGYSINASASGNKITLTNVIVDYNVTGGASDNSSVNSNSNNSVILRGAEIGGSIVGTKGANNSVTFESGTNKINGTVDISGNLLIKTDTVNTVNQSAKVGNLTIEGGQNVFENGATVANNVTIQSGDNQFLGDLVITAGDLKASAGDNTFANITLSAGNITFSGAGNNVYTGNITSTNLSFAGGAHNFQSQLDITTTNDVVASGDSHLYLGEGADIAFTKSLIINSQLTLRSDARLAVVGDTGLGVVGTLDLGENLLNVDGNATFYDKASFIFDSSSTAQGALRATGDIGVNRTTDIVKVTPLSAINVNTSLPIMYTDSTGTISLDEETNLVSDYFVFHKSSDTSGANITVEFKQFDEIVDNIIANLDTDLTPNQAELVNLAKKMEASLDVNDDAKVLLVSLIDRFIKAAATNDSSIVDRLFRESNGEFLVNAYTAALESAIKTQGVVFKRLDQIHDSLAPTPPAAGSADAFNRVWVGGFGSWARQKNREGIFGYDYNSGGFSLGYDRRAEGTPGLGFGVVTSFSFGKIDSNSGVSTVDVDTAGVGLYGSYLLDNGLFLDANFAYAHSKNESKVFTIGGGHKRGDFGVDTWQIGTRLGKIFDLGNIKLTPTLGLRYLSVDQEAFRERVVNTTTAFINYVPKKKDHIFEIPVLLKLNGAFETGTTKIIPEFRVGYTFVPQRPDSELKVGILGFSEGLMTINGIKPARGSVQVGLGAKFEINDQFDVFVNYDLDAAKKFVNHNAAIGIGFNF
ncbi:MAG: autotransporter domain-containing protein [Deltaproteobacteria bacterium]|nr:autotransporter domain-containing protein [Deltaproteobacteria bacterium]